MTSGVKKVLSALLSLQALVGLLIAFGKPLWRLVEMASDLDFLLANAAWIGAFLDTGWGTLVLGAVGLGMVGHALYKARSAEQVVADVESVEEPSQERGSTIRHQKPYDSSPSHEHLWPTIQPVETFVPELKWSVPSTDSFRQQFERYDSFTVDEAISLLCEERPMFAPIMNLDTFSSLNTKQTAVKHLIIAEYKAGQISLDHFNNPSHYSEDYSKSRISNDDVLAVADRMDDPPEYMLFEDGGSDD